MVRAVFRFARGKLSVVHAGDVIRAHGIGPHAPRGHEGSGGHAPVTVALMPLQRRSEPAHQFSRSAAGGTPWAPSGYWAQSSSVCFGNTQGAALGGRKLVFRVSPPHAALMTITGSSRAASMVRPKVNSGPILVPGLSGYWTPH